MLSPQDTKRRLEGWKIGPPLKAHGRSLAEFQPLHPAEKKLLQACRTGAMAVIADERPEEQTADNLVRAGFLRFLALGGDERAPVHERGVRLRGAWITGELDVTGATVPRNLGCWECHFELTPAFRGASVAGSLLLSGSRVPGFEGDGMTCSGSLFLRDKFSSVGEIRLLGARIGGNLDCSGAAFDGKDGDVLLMDGAEIKGDVFLRKGFSATGTVRLPGARIGGDLDCTDAAFDGKDGDTLLADSAEIKGSVFLRRGFSATGEVRLLGARIGGDLECTGAEFGGENRGLSADGIDIAGSLFLRKLKTPLSRASFASAHVEQLVDDMASWGDDLTLDGFTYDAIAGGAPTDATTRLAWLKKQRRTHRGSPGANSNFRPQPWQQLIKVLRAMGHMEDARQVAIAREEHLRAIGKIGETPAAWPPWKKWIYRPLSRGLHRAFGFLIGYGYRPLRMVLLMVLVWLTCGAFYWYAATDGVMAPSNPLVFDHPRYEHCRPDYIPGLGQAPARPKAGNWYVCPELSGEYTTFSPLVYSLDLILPLVDLQQDRDWAPIIPTPKDMWHAELGHLTLNHWTRFAVWFEILFGWIASLLLVAVLSGLTNRDRD